MTSTNRIYNMKRFSKRLPADVPPAARLTFAARYGPLPFDAACAGLGYLVQAIRESGNRGRAIERHYVSTVTRVPLDQILAAHSPCVRPLDFDYVRELAGVEDLPETHLVYLTSGGHYFGPGNHEVLEALRRRKESTARVVHRPTREDLILQLWEAAVQAGHRYALGRHAAEYRRAAADLLSAAAPAWGLDAGAPADAVVDRILEELGAASGG